MDKRAASSRDTVFTLGQVQVECTYPIQRLHHFTLKQQLNQHALLHLEGILWESQGMNWLHRVTRLDPISVYAQNQEGQDGRVLLFSGVVTNVEMVSQNQLQLVRIQAASYSSLLDYQERSRSFQDGSMPYESLIREVLREYPGSMFLCPAIPEGQTLSQILLQYRETDWVFLKRLASRFHAALIPDILGNAPRFSVGPLKGLVELTDGSLVVAKQNIRRYQAGLETFEEPYITCHLDSTQRLHLGDRVLYQNQTLIVERVEASSQDQVLTFTYTLGKEEEYARTERTNPRLPGISLLGTVLEVEGQRVKVKLDIDRDSGREGAGTCWFPFASQAGNLFYCMPEPGTVLSLYFPSDREEDAMAVNAVRKNGGSCAGTSNPNLKYMATSQGKEWKLGETDIRFTAQDELFLSMDGDTGLQFKSHEDLNIFSRQKLLLKAAEQFKVLAKTGDVILHSKGVSSLYMMGGAEGDTHVMAGSNLIYNGRFKEVFTERLNEEIAYEEKKFDWLELGKNVLIGLAAVATVCVVATAVVATAGAAGVAIGAAGSIIAGAAVSGSVAVIGTAVGDILRGEVSSTKEYFLAGAKGAIEGAVSGAVLGLPALKGATLFGSKLLAKSAISGTTAVFTDGISQGIEVLTGQSKNYDWKRGLFSFGIGAAMPVVSRGIHTGAQKLSQRYGTKMPGWVQKGLCMLGGEPVDLIEGNVLYDTVDFELPGPLPLVFKRNWCSASQVVGHLGHGTRYNYEMGMEELEEERALAVFLPDGRVGMFNRLFIGEEAFSYADRLLLRRREEFYELLEPDTGYRYQLREGAGGYLPYKLTSVCDQAGHTIEFSYDTAGYLSQIRDSGGRVLKATVNGDGRLTRIALEEGGILTPLVQYEYSKEQDLTEVTDAMGKVLHMKYSNHLLRQKTDRNNHSFYWNYDQEGDGARAVESWGDGGVLTVLIDYHDKERYPEVRTCRDGKTTRYEYDQRSLCTRIINPDFSETSKVYNERYQVVQTVDEEGRATSFQYNDLSQTTGITLGDGSKQKFAYDPEGALIQATNPEGNSQNFEWNPDGTLARAVDEEGRETLYRYNEQKLVETVVNAKGEEIRLGYDRHLNVSRITLPDGSTARFEYDGRGNCLSETNPLGAMETYRYDALNRMVRANLSDGNQVALTYDGYDDVLKAKDNQREVTFTYTILGSMTSRTQEGRTLRYHYDSEEQLVSVTNEKGETWRFDRDGRGNVIKEVQYGGQTYEYDRDYSGRIKEIHRPRGRYTRYEYDKIGQVIRTDYHDGSFDAFVYDKNGALIEAENQHVKVRLERDKTGQVIKEWQDYDWAASGYDEAGNCIRSTSCFGADVRMERNAMGQVIKLSVFRKGGKRWESQMDYNCLGQETRRLVFGGICSRFEYDKTGRPIQHVVRAKDRPGKGGEYRRRKYEWGSHARLRSVTNECSGGSVSYTYDSFGSLIGSRTDLFEKLFRVTDEVGNLYEREDRSDRIYGAGGRLERSAIKKGQGIQSQSGRPMDNDIPDGTHYFYDLEGNLTRKVESSGDTWFYTYYGNGMLKKVVKPDRSEVSFLYDPFCRRIEKAVSGEGREKGLPRAETGTALEEVPWGKVGGGFIRQAVKKRQDSHADAGAEQSLYVEESLEPKGQYRTVIRFLWSGNTLLHEWEVGEEGKRRLRRREYEKADYILKMEERADRKARAEAEKGTEPPKSLITWVFQDDFIPRAKVTEDGSYSIISDYPGTPVEAYDEEGRKVWERELDLYGRVKRSRKDRFGSATELVGEDGFIPFRYQGQYEDGEIGLYYNRFRYYDPKMGQYTQVDPIGLEGDNPTIYAYVSDLNSWIDIFGLKIIQIYHYTSKQGYNIISSQKPFVFKASTPVHGNPSGVYLTTKSPEALIQTTNGFKKLGLTSDKSSHYFEFTMDDSKLKPLKGGRGDFILYHDGDLVVDRGSVSRHGKVSC